MNLEALWPFQLTRGHSKDPRKGACLLDAVSWFEDGCLNDKPTCVSPVLARLGHFANDVLDDTGRQELRRFIPRLVGPVDERADRLRVNYLTFVCEGFAKRWDDAPLGCYSAKSRFRFWGDRNSLARDRTMSAAARTEILTGRLYVAHQHVQGVHHWIDPIPLPIPFGDAVVGGAWTACFNCVTAQEDVERIAVDLLDVCCAIGAPQVEWDFSRVPAAIERFQKARETV